MELYVRTFAANIAHVLAGLAAVCIAVGTLDAAIKVVTLALRRRGCGASLLRVRSAMAIWLSLALEFAMASDILLIALAPSWRELVTLASIVVLRAAINYSISRDLTSIADLSAAPTTAGVPS